MIINSRIQFGPKFHSTFADETVKNEPMLFNCSGTFAEQHGGVITHAFLNGVKMAIDSGLIEVASLDDLIFDSRVHMLMPGMFPCIPGMHHDDVPRPLGNPGGQPDYVNPRYRARHALGLVNAHIAPTQFAVGSAEFALPEEGEVIYNVWHKKVEEYLKSGSLTSVSAESGRILLFDDRSWHQGTEGTQFGWRWFARVSWNTERVPTNEIRRQVQVYMPTIHSGW